MKPLHRVPCGGGGGLIYEPLPNIVNIHPGKWFLLPDTSSAILYIEREVLSHRLIQPMD
jgi:hypothetical protein